MKTLSSSLLAAALALAALPSIATAAPACGTENLLARKKPSTSQAVKGDIAQVTDGVAAPEGAQWDSAVGVILENANSSITYDLGEERSISAVVLQADANDTYKVMASTDGSPASYKLLVELANVVTTGHGLRTRAVARRPGLVTGGPGWLEVQLPLSSVDLAIRRAGLDLDPGWVPWLGTVIRYRYA